MRRPRVPPPGLHPARRRARRPGVDRRRAECGAPCEACGRLTDGRSSPCVRAAAPCGARPVRPSRSPARRARRRRDRAAGRRVAPVSPTEPAKRRARDVARVANRWRTVATTYPRPGGGPDDVVATDDDLRRADGPNLPICVWGTSSGGDLALRSGAPRRGVVAAQAAPTEPRRSRCSWHGYFDQAFGPGSDDPWSRRDTPRRWSRRCAR